MCGFVCVDRMVVSSAYVTVVMFGDVCDGRSAVYIEIIYTVRYTLQISRLGILKAMARVSKGQSKKVLLLNHTRAAYVRMG